MDSLIRHEKRTSCRIPLDLSVIGTVIERQIRMGTQNISREGMFLYSTEHVRLRSVFEAWISLGPEEELLRCFLTACFIERTASGYGIGASFAGISNSDRARWEAFYRAAVAQHGRQIREQAESAERAASDCRVLVLDNALPQAALQVLRDQHFQVESSVLSAQLLGQLQQRPPAIVVSDLSDERAAGLELCCAIRAARLPTLPVLLTANATPQEFQRGLSAGAAQVIAKPCSHELLVTSLKQALHRTPALGLQPAAPRPKQAPLFLPRPAMHAHGALALGAA